MTLLELLLQLLEAQAETLRLLSGLLGERVLVALLERAGDRAEELGAPLPPVESEAFEPSFSGGDPYARLEDAVRALKLPSQLEFHLWAYAAYRAFIESPLTPDARIIGPGAEAGSRIVARLMSQAETWLADLGLPEPYASQARRSTQAPWLRFRAACLKRLGQSPVAPVVYHPESPSRA